MKDLGTSSSTLTAPSNGEQTPSKFTPGPWKWRDVSGAGLQISAKLPAGFNFSGIARLADGITEFMTWTVRDTHWVEIADERWAQFSTGSWSEMQEANARLIAAAPTMHEYIAKLAAAGCPEAQEIINACR